jgi:hypothetical protein
VTSVQKEILLRRASAEADHRRNLAQGALHERPGKEDPILLDTSARSGKDLPGLFRGDAHTRVFQHRERGAP